MRRVYPFTVIFTVLLLAAFGSATAMAGSSAVSTKLKTEQIDLNKASVEQLSTLPGIGEKKALAIIDYRTKKGPFASIDGLLQVKGIGEKLFEKIKPNVTVSIKRHDLPR